MVFNNNWKANTFLKCKAMHILLRFFSAILFLYRQTLLRTNYVQLVRNVNHDIKTYPCIFFVDNLSAKVSCKLCTYQRTTKLRKQLSKILILMSTMWTKISMKA